MAKALRQTHDGTVRELENVTDPDEQMEAKTGTRYGAAELGFRHYWYPALLSRQLGEKPKSVTLLGEKLVFIRGNGRPYALFDRCAHRGMPLSEGRCWTEGTLTCPYHGWTYRLGDGELMAALTDGPESAVVGKKGKGVRSYPVEERNGVIYVYMGDDKPPPLEEDVPEELLKPEYVFEAVTSVWNSNWRPAVENGYDASHATYVHRYSLRWRTQFNLPPAWAGKVESEVQGKYLIQRRRGPFGFEANYPGFGLWPRHAWLRKALAKVRQKFGPKGKPMIAGVRLPCIIVNHYTYYSHIRYSIPIDANHTRNFQMLAGKYHGLKALAFRLQYWLWHRWVFHKWFNEGQDKWIVEHLDYSAPEMFFRPDAALVQLRKYFENTARTSDPVDGMKA